MTNAMTTIILRNDASAKVWTAETKGYGYHDLIKLFGTSVLPTPFTSSCSADKVREAIQRLNPHADVIVMA